MYDKFPTPLINRLEKHFVLSETIISDWQNEVLNDLEEWINNYIKSIDAVSNKRFISSIINKIIDTL